MNSNAITDELTVASQHDISSEVASDSRYSNTNQLTDAERIALLKRHGGHVLSFCSMQPGMQYFDVPEVGYISYMRSFTGKPFLLGDPVCAKENMTMMLDKFMAKYPDAVFCQVSKTVMQYLHDRYRYYGTQMGTQSVVDLKKWSLSGKKKQVIRTAINQAEKKGVEIHESLCANQTREISENWLKTRKVKSNEIRFLIRPLHMDYSEGVRYFYAFQDDKPVGFVFFDPIYENGKLVSYVPNVSRSSSEFNQGLWYAIMAHAMEVFKSEGLERLDLGLIPMSFDSEDEPQESKFIKGGMRFCYKHANFLYNFKGIEFTKHRFRGEIEKTYVCHKKSLAALDFISMLRIVNVI